MEELSLVALLLVTLASLRCNNLENTTVLWLSTCQVMGVLNDYHMLPVLHTVLLLNTVSGDYPLAYSEFLSLRCSQDYFAFGGTRRRDDLVM